MLIPAPLPDELAAGLLGRIRAINGLQTVQETLQALRSNVRTKVGASQDESEIALLANVTAMTPSLFSHHHTLNPFRRAFSKNVLERANGLTKKRNVRALYHQGIAARPSYFCSDCVHEDELFWGFSYWRRTHHLQGINWCLKHRTPLRYCDENDAHSSLPGSYIANARSIGADEVKCAQRNPVVTRYIDICVNLLERRGPMHSQAVMRLLRTKANERGLKITGYGSDSRPLLSDLVFSHLPFTWLRTNFPEFRNKIRFHQFEFIDQTIRSPDCSAARYALAAAVLFPNDVGLFSAYDAALLAEMEYVCQ